MSKQLTSKLVRLRAEFARLEELAMNPPELPVGWGLAVVVSVGETVGFASDHAPGLGEQVVVPHTFAGDILVQAHGAGVCVMRASEGWAAEDRWEIPGFGWGETPEEAIANFLADGEWLAEDC